ncbi:MAG TPA: nucleotidyl transferase AbiEii/AbiGii toxin family protein [candidate division WOR-3 bacterium]|uniref:Nucleotidyl transferase AbiEii/AbiGii toxin family protein n=1 Tax=candidate division WOR-3 bacterium TaxID=2052148 RepID=A0A9C9ENK4_UNCW3|nr:nucleotidyl transferase AbiEii/AbiGii toxin family protein [candidate division WOR-3 bacterium]
MIPQRNLSLLSNRLARGGGRRIPETVLERDYCLSWFLIGLSYSPLKDILLFKGGTCIKKCYIPDYRFSEDLDFTLAEECTFEDIQKHLDIAFKHTHLSSGVKLYFSHYDRHTHENTYTFFLGYEGPLPAVSGKEVKVDITIREKIVYPVEEKIILRGYEGYEDLPEDAAIRTYSIDEIAVEKVVALLDRARNEPRDLYDIWYLTSNQHVNLAELIEAVEEKWKFRGKKLTDVREEFLRKEARLKKLWKMRLSSQVALLPEFGQVYRIVQRELRQAGMLKQRKI